MAEWRVGRGWSTEALRARLDRLPTTRSVEVRDEGPVRSGWHHYHSEAVIARDPGVDERFARARAALASYQFSDPSIVTAHFDPASPLLDRRMLLEIKVLGLHYLCPALVTRVRDEPDVYGFRYHTLDGHIERGVEWFLLTRDAQGDLRFRIEARWQEGDLPNWWSRIGFRLVAGRYQRRWHREAHRRLSRLAHGDAPALQRDRAGLTHQGVDVTFTWHTKRKWF